MKRVRFKDLTGQVFGRLTVISQAEPKADTTKRVIYWNVRCECGTERVVEGPNLYKGNTKSCGCLRRERGRMLLKLAHQKALETNS